MRGDYGHLVRGEVAEVGDDIAKKLIKRGTMEAVDKSVPFGVPGQAATGKAGSKKKTKTGSRKKSQPTPEAPDGSPTAAGEPSSSSDQAQAPDGTAPSSEPASPGADGEALTS